MMYGWCVGDMCVCVCFPVCVSAHDVWVMYDGDVTVQCLMMYGNVWLLDDKHGAWVAHGSLNNIVM